mgnify:CR=1 FL=1|tara:strand:+ start:114 stop:677 length:564 start_codon:yes stop_codon:yes gene_type:complete
MSEKSDFLTHDPMHDIPRQKFACVSILTPDDIDVRNRSYFEARCFAMANHPKEYPTSDAYDVAIKDWCKERQGDLDCDFKDHSEGKPHIPIMKIRGVFKNETKANQRCRKLASLDPTVDIGVCSVGVWVPADGKCREDETDIVYAEKEMQTLMKNRIASQNAARAMFEKHKNQALMDSVGDGATKTE